MKAQVFPMVNPDEQARRKFASHVQNVAFNLTLSRRMIDLLQVVRDYGFPYYVVGSKQQREEYDRFKSVCEYQNGAHQYINMVNALERRGLVILKPFTKKTKIGDRNIVLSRAGEIVCDMLVESGLMPCRNEAQTKAAGSR